MSFSGIGNPPGLQPSLTALATPLLWSGEGHRMRMITLDAASEDAGNAPTTHLRAGLVLARHDSTGKYHPYDPSANDGRQNPIGILEHAVDMLVAGQASERVARMLVAGAVRERYVPNLDARARTALEERFAWDELSASGAVVPGMAGPARRVSGSVNHTAADHATTLVATGAISLSLPPAAPGLAFRIVQPTDNSVTLSGLENLVAKGASMVDTLLFDAAGNRIGTHLLVECIAVDDQTLAWLVSNLGGTTFVAS